MNPIRSIIIGIVLLIGIIYLSLTLDMEKIHIINISYIFSVAEERQIITEIRVPRLIVGCLAGALFAVSGSIFQKTYRNHMASPDLLGINAAAVFSIVFLTIIFADLRWVISFGALGAILGFGATLLLVGKTTSKVKLIIIGLALSILFRALSQLVLIKSPEKMHSLILFLNGSLVNASWDTVNSSLAPAIILLTLSFGFAGYLPFMSVQPITARSLGVNVAICQIGFIGVGLLMSALAVGISGSLGFVGLIAPNLARIISSKASSREHLLLSMLSGIVLVSISDIIARIVCYPDEIPSGLIMIVLGAPLFISMLHSMSKVR